ncbi:terminal uridylyltransferase Tailor-like [Musca domestica]|uniref:Terminal uridylyltransferase Tailor-like n=1 Tax=Musca domestica TaxID=7370 RepID=A0ABM3VGS7_MUSDO|nr:terminal uridylyltransferase Tailor-like [Musca domestica]
MGEVQKYIHPLTIEAKLFVDNMNKICATRDYFILDPQLVEALENVMTTINDFIEKANTEIVPTAKTQLIEMGKLHKLQRIYHCGQCKADLGTRASKVALHLAEDCKLKGRTSETLTKDAREELKKERKERAEKRKEQRLTKAVALKKKARLFLATDPITAFTQLSTAVQIGEKLKCIPDYAAIENDLLEQIKPLFPNQPIKIYKFGSRMSGIGTRDSDLDLFIDIGDTFKVYQNRANDATLAKLKKVKQVLINHKKSWKGLVAVEKARVPILKVIHGPTSIECDMNFSNSLGYINTNLMEYIYGLQPTARVLCIYMKRWLQLIGMKNDFNTYSINLMVIFYLQTLEHLPPIAKLFEDVNMETALVIGPWLGTFTSKNLQALKIKYLDTGKLFDLIEGFFKFYLEFDYNRNVICPYQGSVISKKDLHTCMPERYLNFVANSKDLEIELKKPLVVQDPIQLNHNVTKGIVDFTLKVFLEFMSKSRQIVLQSKSQ